MGPPHDRKGHEKGYAEREPEADAPKVVGQNVRYTQPDKPSGDDSHDCPSNSAHLVTPVLGFLVIYPATTPARA